MRPFLKLFIVLAVAAAALCAAPGPARADEQLDAYRASGVIAERFDGYVEVRDANAPSEARALVADVNAKRRALYDQRASGSNVPVAEVGKVFANKIVETAPPGTYFRQPSGSYVRK
ncbi:MAG TPA: YdbL family protein [Thermohalobaculum sp.]|nr:YdbL family protein [Thermohalobaculum sp.]